MKRIALAALLAAAACGPKRSTAASQPSPAAFDVAKSDPKALAVIDAGMTALGGYDRWLAVKELRFDVKYSLDGKLLGWNHHAWDRWNGRHEFGTADTSDPAKVTWLTIRYDIYDDGKIPFGTFKGSQIDEKDTAKYVAVAKQKLSEDGYYALVPFKLRDPGVHVSDAGPTPPIAGNEDLCQPSCESIQVTFDPTVGKDTWLVDYNTDSHLPQIIEKVVPEGHIAFRFDGWTDAGGLKFPTKLTNVGVKTQTIEYSQVAIGEPKDSTYEAPIDRSQGTSTKTNEGQKGIYDGPEATPGMAQCADSHSTGSATPGGTTCRQ